MALQFQPNKPHRPGLVRSVRTTRGGRPSGHVPAGPLLPSVDELSEPEATRVATSGDGNVVSYAQSHDRAHLIYSPNGVLVVQSDAGHWVVPPVTVLQLVPDVTYALRKASQVVVRTIALPETLSQCLSEDSCLYRLTPLARELLESLHHDAIRHDDVNDNKAQFLVDVLVEAGVWQDETRHRCRSVPQDPRVAQICEYIYNNLDATKTLQEWADELRNDTRTLHRLFVQEFGMSFIQWRQQIRLMAALEWLAEGRQVMDVALDLGYQTQSAFAAMFRRNMGITPSEWQDRRHPHVPRSSYTAPAG